MTIYSDNIKIITAPTWARMLVFGDIVCGCQWRVGDLLTQPHQQVQHRRVQVEAEVVDHEPMVAQQVYCEPHLNYLFRFSLLGVVAVAWDASVSATPTPVLSSQVFSGLRFVTFPPAGGYNRDCDLEARPRPPTTRTAL